MTKIKNFNRSSDNWKLNKITHICLFSPKHAQSCMNCLQKSQTSSNGFQWELLLWQLQRFAFETFMLTNQTIVHFYNHSYIIKQFSQIMFLKKRSPIKIWLKVSELSHAPMLCSVGKAITMKYNYCMFAVHVTVMQQLNMPAWLDYAINFYEPCQ